MSATSKPVLGTPTGYPTVVLPVPELLAQIAILQRLATAPTAADFRRRLIAALFAARVRPGLRALGLPAERSARSLGGQVGQLERLRRAVKRHGKGVQCPGDA